MALTVGPLGQGWASVLRDTPGWGAGHYGGTGGMPRGSGRHPPHTVLSQAVRVALPSLLITPQQSWSLLEVSPRLRWMASPTYVVVLGGVAGGGPEEVLGELGFHQPVDFAALGAPCASSPPHPQVLT